MIDPRKLLSRRTQSSADLIPLIGEAQANHSEASIALAQMTEKRAGLLLSADDATLAAHDAEISALQRHQDRAEAVKAELERRRAEKAEQEAEAARRQRYEAATARIAAGKLWLQEAYPKLAGEIGKGIANLAELEALIVTVNADLPAGEAEILPLEGSVRNVAGAVEPLSWRVALPGLTGRDLAYRHPDRIL